jgi:hypothetical protein
MPCGYASSQIFFMGTLPAVKIAGRDDARIDLGQTICVVRIDGRLPERLLADARGL